MLDKLLAIIVIVLFIFLNFLGWGAVFDSETDTFVLNYVLYAEIGTCLLWIIYFVKNKLVRTTCFAAVFHVLFIFYPLAVLDVLSDIFDTRLLVPVQHPVFLGIICFAYIINLLISIYFVVSNIIKAAKNKKVHV